VDEDSEPKSTSEAGSAVSDLERLVAMHERGALTDEEFQAAKARLLDL